MAGRRKTSSVMTPFFSRLFLDVLSRLAVVALKRMGRQSWGVNIVVNMLRGQKSQLFFSENGFEGAWYLKRVKLFRTKLENHAGDNSVCKGRGRVAEWARTHALSPFK